MFILSLSDSRQLRIYYIPWPAKNCCQNSYTNLSAINSQKLCSLHSQLAKAAKKRTSKKHMIYTVVPWLSLFFFDLYDGSVLDIYLDLFVCIRSDKL